MAEKKKNLGIKRDIFCKHNFYVKFSAYIFYALVIMLFTADIYSVYLGFKVSDCGQNNKLAEVCPELKSVNEECGWGLNPWTRFLDNKDKTETVWKNGQRASRLSDSVKSEKKVLLIGCSYLFGSGIGDKDTLAWKLNRRFPDIQFDNYGVPGWGTAQCLRLEQELLKHHKYDLVCYLAIDDHKCRNIEYRFLGSLKAKHRYAMYPRVIDRGESFEFIASDKQKWLLEDKINLINFLHRAYIGYWAQYFQKEYECRVNSEGIAYDKYMPKREEMFWKLVHGMKDTAHEYKTDFVMGILEGNFEKWLYSSIPKDLEENIWPMSFPEIYTSDFRLNGDIYEHPNESANTVWYFKFCEYFQKMYGTDGKMLVSSSYE